MSNEAGLRPLALTVSVAFPGASPEQTMTVSIPLKAGITGLWKIYRQVGSPLAEALYDAAPDTLNSISRESAGHRSRRIFPVADVLQKLRYLIPVRAALRRDFITYTPHHDARVVPVLTEHIDHIFLRPGAEMPMIAV